MFFFTCIVIACIILIAGIVNSPVGKLLRKTRHDLGDLSI